MRLTALVLERYGPFAEQRIELDPAPGRLNLLVARNGAGKSVLRHAFSDLLFGIPAQSAMNFRHGYAGMTLRAELLGPDGQPGVLVRRKGQGNTLADAAGEPVTAAALAALLGHADRDLLERLFSLDSAFLRQGGEELLASGGELADALLAATGQLHKAHDMAAELERLRDEAAPLRRHAARPFYRDADALAAARKAARAVRRPEEWRRREAEAEAAEAAQAAANAAERAASARLALLERVRRTRPLLAERDAAQAWLDAHPHAPALPPGLPLELSRKLAAAREAGRRAADRLDEARRRRDAAALAAAAVRPDASLLAEAEAIAALADMAGAARQAEDDLPLVAGENAAAMGRLAGLLRALGSDLPPARAAELLPPHPAQAEARRLIDSHAELAGQVGRLPGLIAAREAERATLAAALAALPGAEGDSGSGAEIGFVSQAGPGAGARPGPDAGLRDGATWSGTDARAPGDAGPQDARPRDAGPQGDAAAEPLEPLLREVGRDGDPGARAEAAAARAQALRQAAATALARLPAGLHAAPLAPPAGLERRLRALEAARTAQAGCAREAATASARLAELTRRLAALAEALAGPGHAEAALPDEAALAAIRRHRDAGWQLVFRQGFTAAPPDAHELAAWSGSEPLPLAFARAMADADRLADRRTAEAQRLAEAATLARGRAEAEAALAEARAAVAAAAASTLAAQADWVAACAPLGLTAEAAPSELREALAAREDALAATEAARLAEAEAAALSGRHAGWATRLARTLRARAEDGLPALLAAAEALQARRRSMAAERARLGGQLDAVDKQLAAWRTELAAATRLLDAWASAWGAALRGLGRPEETPHATAAALALLVELETAVADAAQREARQQGMRDRLQRFAATAARLAARLAPSLAPPPDGVPGGDAAPGADADVRGGPKGGPRGGPRVEPGAPAGEQGPGALPAGVSGSDAHGPGMPGPRVPGSSEPASGEPASGMPGADPFAAVRALTDALAAAERARVRRGELDLACAAATAELAQAEAELREAASTLAGVLAALGAADAPAGGDAPLPSDGAAPPPDAPPDARDATPEARLALAAEAETHRAALRDATARLHEAGDGLSPDQLCEAAARIAPEALPAEAEHARTQQQEAAATAQAAARNAALLREALAREAAAEPEAAAAEAAALAGIGRTLEDALLLHAAGALLRHGLRELEARADTTMVRRIGDAFAALTDFEYEGVSLAQAAARGAGTLMPVEHAFPHERRDVSQLSEGTRDQLYLALRLVAIEDHVRAAPPLPFLADDILQTFDDRRAGATLRALLALSHTTQVVVLTHHEHLVRLAAELPVNLQRF